MPEPGVVDVALDGKGLLATCYDHSYDITLWEVSTGKPLKKLVGHTNTVCKVAFDGNGLLASRY